MNYLEAWQARFSLKYETIVKSVYGSILPVLLSWRHTIFALGVALLLPTLGYMKSGRMGMSLLPKIESDYAFCEIYLPYGTPETKVCELENRLVASAQKTVDENGKQNLSTGIFSRVSENIILSRIYLTDPGVCPISTSEVTRIWREKIGPVAGHIIMGHSLSILSLFGVVAMAGVVVNDALMLIDFANRQVRCGMPVRDAVRAAGIQRFRPIILTTLTTCGGLAPIIMETSRQAQYLIPMAISLGFGLLFATLITLGLVPCLYLILEDIKTIFNSV